MRHIVLIYCLLASLSSVWAQGTQVEFGKNRVQYHEDFAEWSQYESDNFITYWYGEGRYIGQATVQLAEYDFQDIQNVLEHRINDKIQIIVYTDITDLKQSNIGSEEAFNNTGGQTKIVGNKMFVYFNGDHNHLRQQIREGITSVYLNAMLFGSNLQEIVQNAVMLNLPLWFKEGLVAYVGVPWTTELDNELRDYILDEEFEGFEQLAEERPKLAGHSLWYFISENYGKATVSNLLYLTRINRSIESGFLYVLGTPYQRIGDSWALYFRQRYRAESEQREMPQREPVEIKNKRNLPITQAKISPDGQSLVYVTNEIGRYKIYLHDLNTGERKVVLKDGFRNAFQATDYNYPLLAWNPSGQELAILFERRDQPQLMLYDVYAERKKIEPLSPQYQRIYSMEYVGPQSMVFSGAVRGQSDIFLYYINTRQTQRITNDFWDDLDPAFTTIHGQRGILFASNRPDSVLQQRQRLDTILPIGTFDIFYYNMDTRSQELVRVTNTPYSNERQPMGVDTTWFAYLSDRTGISNRETGYLEDYIHHYDQLIELEDGSEIRLHIDSTLSELDSTLIDTIRIDTVIKQRAITHPNSNFARGILTQSKSRRTSRIADLMLIDGRHEVFIRPAEPVAETSAFTTSFRQRKNLNERKASTPLPPPSTAPPTINILTPTDTITVPETVVEPAQQDTGQVVDIDNYMFQSEFDDEEEEEEEQEVIVVEREQTPQAPAPVSSQEALANYLARTQAKEEEIYRFRPASIVPYRLEFRTDFVTTQMDNSLLFDGLNSFAASPDQFLYPPLGILLKANFKDLFEDYEFEGGVRIPTSFNGSEYFLVFNDKKKRLDKQYAVYRRNIRQAGEGTSFVPNRREVNTVLGQFGVRYPLDIFQSLRGTATLRRDRITQLSTERGTLQVPSINEQRIGLRLEYVFDNTLDVSLNIKNGTRAKVWVEGVKRFNLQASGGDASLRFNEGIMSIIAFDGRHYERVLKHSVLATRLAGATSFGSERMIYYLGGVDNWLFNNFNNTIPQPDPNDAVAFQALATNMRGFNLNIRNGSSYVVSNTELRVPIFKYLANKSRSSFLQNFQAIGFFDIGTAWEGTSPFSRDNPLNTSVVDNSGLVSVQVSYFRNPIVAGYGFGVRTLLFGYFLRLDYAWGLETRRVQDPRIHLSLGMDF